MSIYGDGETSRDFCYIDNIVQANILAATTNEKQSLNQIYNIAVGRQTSLKELYALIVSSIQAHKKINIAGLRFSEFRSGDVRHSLADISKANKFLGYKPISDLEEGIEKTIQWYLHKALN